MEIADENHVALGRYCGEELAGRDVNVGGNEVVIKFHSDYYFGKRGFLLFLPLSNLVSLREAFLPHWQPPASSEKIEVFSCSSCLDRFSASY